MVLINDSFEHICKVSKYYASKAIRSRDQITGSAGRWWAISSLPALFLILNFVMVFILLLELHLSSSKKCIFSNGSKSPSICKQPTFITGHSFAGTGTGNEKVVMQYGSRLTEVAKHAVSKWLSILCFRLFHVQLLHEQYNECSYLQGLQIEGSLLWWLRRKKVISFITKMKRREQDGRTLVRRMSKSEKTGSRIEKVRLFFYITPLGLEKKAY